MKRKNIIITSALLAGILLFSLSKTGRDLFQNLTQKTSSQKPQPTSEHTGHASDSVTSQPASSQQAPVETPLVEIPSDKQQLIGVKTTIVSMMPLQKMIRAAGRIEYDERRLSTVNTKIEGWIEKLHIDYIGRYIKKGEPLVEIYSPELIATQQEFINLLKWRQKSGKEDTITSMLSKDAEAIIEAAKQRLRLWDITEEQIKKIEETAKPVRTLTIFSPVSGYVVQKTALQGMRIMIGERLFDIADLSIVWVIADVYEYEMPLISIGQTATIALSYIPEKEFKATIEYVYPSLSAETKTAKIRFSIPNPDGKLKPQMYTNVVIKSDISKRLIIPEDAVIDTGMRQIVYVDKGDGYFEPREITIGIRADGLVEVIRGLKAGEKIASSATFLIDSEAKLKGIAPAGGHKH
ncbi:MAG: efflux RND transporter periplasmic adaptor subunit [Thermodesulfovibrionales bacterium]|nr:efflux RND transporter periplasmic adaptor subunit [Thermodesulfovibrionales bacterium]